VSLGVRGEKKLNTTELENVLKPWFL